MDQTILNVKLLGGLTDALRANGFMEWKALEKGKQPYYVHSANDALFGLAGLWERWSPPEGEPIDTFTIITIDANAAIRALHDRMPVILAPEHFGRWLDPKTPLDAVAMQIAPCPDAEIAMHLVALTRFSARRCPVLLHQRLAHGGTARHSLFIVVLSFKQSDRALLMCLK